MADDSLIDICCLETPITPAGPKISLKCKILRTIAIATYIPAVLACITICIYGYAISTEIGNACSDFRLMTLVYAALFFTDLLCMLIKYIKERQPCNIEPKMSTLDYLLAIIVLARITASGALSCWKTPYFVSCDAYQTTIIWNCFYVIAYYNFLLMIVTYIFIIIYLCWYYNCPCGCDDDLCFLYAICIICDDDD